jgi:hypothetical protein
MMAAARTRILPFFFVASDEYSTPFRIGEQIASLDGKLGGSFCSANSSSVSLL